MSEKEECRIVDEVEIGRDKMEAKAPENGGHKVPSCSEANNDGRFIKGESEDADGVRVGGKWDGGAASSSPGTIKPNLQRSSDESQGHVPSLQLPQQAKSCDEDVISDSEMDSELAAVSISRKRSVTLGSKKKKKNKVQ